MQCGGSLCYAVTNQGVLQSRCKSYSCVANIRARSNPMLAGFKHSIANDLDILP